MGSDVVDWRSGRRADTPARVAEVEITHIERGHGRTLVYAGVHLLPKHVWMNERYSAPEDFICWTEVEKRAWVGEMARRRHEKEKVDRKGD